jgi:hypothetical protein
VVHVGAEEGAEALFALAIEGPRSRDVVGLAADVEVLGEVPAPLVGGREAGGPKSSICSW